MPTATWENHLGKDRLKLINEYEKLYVAGVIPNIPVVNDRGFTISGDYEQQLRYLAGDIYNRTIHDLQEVPFFELPVRRSIDGGGAIMFITATLGKMELVEKTIHDALKLI